MISLTSYLFKKINKNKNRIAIKHNEIKLSYQKLNDKALALATILSEHKNIENQCIAVVGQRNINSYVAILSSFYSGTCYTPINSKQNIHHVCNIINDSKINLFLTDRDDFHFIKKITKLNSITDFTIISIENLEIFKKNFDKGKYYKKNYLKKPVISNENYLAYKLYTSGSTGAPKGVKISYKNLFAWLKNMESLKLVSSSDNLSQNYDLTFDLSIADYLLAWMTGAKLCILNENEQLLPYEYIIREKITVWSSVPTVAKFMIDYGVLKKNIFPRVKVSIFCGEALTRNVADNWQDAAPNSRIENFYGPTEATIWLSKFGYGKKSIYRKFHNKIIPIGKPFKDHKFEIVDIRDKLVKQGEVGEIIYSGPQISSGYSNSKDLTRKSFRKFKWDKNSQIWYLSGDLGFLNKNNHYEFVGRKDNQIKISGRRIEIFEIEGTLLLFKKLKNIIVVPIRNESYSCDGLVAYTNVKINKNDLEKIEKIFQKRMDKLFFPKKFIFVKRFPLNSSGKIDRKSLENNLS